MGWTIRVDTRGIEEKLKKAAQSLQPVRGGIAVRDGNPVPFILEYGSTPGRKPWPTARDKTTSGPGGRIFSKQAPQGYARIFSDRIVVFLRDALLRRLQGRLISRDIMVSAANEAITNAFQLAKAAIPKRSGEAAASLEVKEAR
jgi:hypothetical protein